MDVADIKERLRKAADVIKRLPRPQLVAGYPGRSIPDAVNEDWDAAYEAAGAYDEDRGEAETVVVKDTYVRPSQPQGQEIEDAWEAWDWLGYLQERDRRLVWSWACGADWWKIAARARRSERTVQRYFADAIDRIGEGLKKKAPEHHNYGLTIRTNGPIL